MQIRCVHTDGYVGYLINEDNYIIKKDCAFRNFNLCKNMDCKVEETKVHKNEILLFKDIVFIYPIKTINLNNLIFIFIYFILLIKC